MTDCAPTSPRFQSTLPVWGATCYRDSTRQKTAISIHAPRVGSDCGISDTSPYDSDFNPRSPCGERRVASRQAAKASLFQSTLPVWGATLSFIHGYIIPQNFNPRSPCGERQTDAEEKSSCCYFNPRSPCGERHRQQYRQRQQQKFQSTLPVWGATNQRYQLVQDYKFQSTLPVWGAT